MSFVLVLFGVPVVVALLVLGGITLLNSSRNLANRAFLGICSSFAFWIVANYMADANKANSLLWSRASFLAVTLGIYCFVLFARNFPYSVDKAPFWQSITFNLSSLIVLLIECTNFFIPSVYVENQTSNVVAGSLYFVFPLYLLVYVSYAMGTLVRKMLRASGIDRTRINFVLMGILLTVALGSITNLLLPSITGNNNYATIGTFSTVIFASLTTYAVIKHHLFDIRLIVARSLAYIASLGVITAIFSVLIFGVSGVLGGAGYSETAQRVFYVAVTLTLVLTYPYLKRFFDKVTNKLFYRDAYEPQSFLSDLNDILVTNISLDSLLKQTSDLIVKNIKTEACLFVINSHQDIAGRQVGVIEKVLASDDLEQLRVLIVDKNTKPLIVDGLDQGDKLRQLLRKYNIGCLSHLMSIKGNAKESVGILLLGDKSSGNPYNRQDAKTLEIVANELVIAIQNALRFEEIEKFNITLQQKVDAATTELRQANEKLKALDATKDEFISMASHQLRTPLTAVKGYLSMVLEGDVGKVDDNQKPMLTQAFNSAQRMVYLIADLLNVSRLKTGKFVIESHPTQLADVVEGELAQLTETAKAHKLHLVYNKPANFPMLNLDETKTRQVIMNFVDNAIYYTPAGGTVTIELKDTGTSVELTVTDTGIGVPRSAQPHLFSKFYRADNAQKARPDGTGLGLFMARKVIAAQGGSIIFRSIEGKGSTFGFSFPKAKLQAGTPVPPTQKTPVAV